MDNARTQYVNHVRRLLRGRPIQAGALVKGISLEELQYWIGRTPQNGACLISLWMWHNSWKVAFSGHTVAVARGATHNRYFDVNQGQFSCPVATTGFASEFERDILRKQPDLKAFDFLPLS